MIAPKILKDPITNDTYSLGLSIYEYDGFIWNTKIIYYFEKYNLKLSDKFLDKFNNKYIDTYSFRYYKMEDTNEITRLVEVGDNRAFFETYDPKTKKWEMDWDKARMFIGEIYGDPIYEE